jgi:hypothetical protein
VWESREGNIRRMRKITWFILVTKYDLCYQIKEADRTGRVTYMEGKKNGYMIWWVKLEGKSLIEKPRLRRKILYL